MTNARPDRMLAADDVVEACKHAGMKGQKLELLRQGWENSRDQTAVFLDSLLFSYGAGGQTRYLIVTALYGSQVAQGLYPWAAHPAQQNPYGPQQQWMNPYGGGVPGPFQPPQKKDWADEMEEAGEAMMRLKMKMQLMKEVFGSDDAEAAAKHMGLPYRNNGRGQTRIRREPMLDSAGNVMEGKYIEIEEPFDQNSPQYGMLMATETFKTLREGTKDKQIDIPKMFGEIVKAIGQLTPKQNTSEDSRVLNELKSVRSEMATQKDQIWGERLSNLMQDLRGLASKNSELEGKLSQPFANQLEGFLGTIQNLQKSGLVGGLTPEERMEERKYQREKDERDRTHDLINKGFETVGDILAPASEGLGEAAGEVIKRKLNRSDDDFSPPPVVRNQPPPGAGKRQGFDFDDGSFDSMRQAMDDLPDYSIPFEDSQPDVLHNEITGKTLPVNQKVREEIRGLF